MENPVSFSQIATSQLSNSLKNLGNLDYGVRIELRGGKGCLGLTPVIGLDNKMEDDEIYAYPEFNLYIKKGMFMHVLGYNIDYYEDQMDAGYVFQKG